MKKKLLAALLIGIVIASDSLMCLAASEADVTESIVYETEESLEEIQENEEEKELIEETGTEDTVSQEVIHDVVEESQSEKRSEEVDREPEEQMAEEQIISYNEDLDQTIEQDFSIYAEINGKTYSEYFADNVHYVFLPLGLDLDNVQLSHTGPAVQEVSGGVLNTDGTIGSFSTGTQISVILEDGSAETVLVLQSDLPSIEITLNGVTLDTINAGSKDIKYQGNQLELTTLDNTKITDSNLEVKGRGNSSWNMPKKSYQIKLDKKQNLLGMGKAKTWCLIANYADVSLIRNKFMYSLAEDLGMNYAQGAEYVDLWVDGEYLGNYLLCEKVQVGETRVDLQNDDGLLIEMDNNYYASELNYFASSVSGSHFVLKDSVADDEGEAASQAEGAFAVLKEYINLFESYLYAENKDWEKISSMIDVDSFIDYYFLEELSENADGCRTSMMMYMDGSGDVLHMGPVWDFDLSLANCDRDEWGGNPEIDYIKDINEYMVKSVDWYTQLFKIPEFREKLEVRYKELEQEVFSGCDDLISECKDSLMMSAKMNFIRWNLLGQENIFGSHRGHQYLDTWEEEVEYLRTWVSQRVSYLNRRYSNGFAEINYQVHGETYGWQNTKSGGDTAGTIGLAKRLEAIKISLPEELEGGATYCGHVQGIGWQNEVSDGELCGTVGQAKRLEAVWIQLNGELADNYDIYYRVHVQTYGWLDWAKNGEIAGTVGLGKRMEAIQIKLVLKGSGISGETERPSIILDELKNADVSIGAHVQTYGWKPAVSGNETAGTVGQAKRLEAIMISMTGISSELGGISYCAHVQTYGWMDWKSDGQVAGTVGQAKRLEAIQIKLTGKLAEYYDVYYRVHVQTYGWSTWVKNGETAGTTGLSKRLEAIEIKLVSRN